MKIEGVEVRMPRGIKKMSAGDSDWMRESVWRPPSLAFWKFRRFSADVSTVDRHNPVVRLAVEFFFSALYLPELHALFFIVKCTRIKSRLNVTVMLFKTFISDGVIFSLNNE